MLRSTLTLMLLAVAAVASAEDFDYTYFNAGYGIVEFDDIDVDGDGFGIGGSFEIGEQFHAFAGYELASLDFDVDATQWNAGFGYHTMLSEVVGAYANLSYQYVEVDVPGFGSADDNGYGFAVGLRFAATPELELTGGIQYVDLSDSGDNTGFGAGGLYSFTDNFAVGLAGSWDDDATSYQLTGRFYFGQ